MIPNLILREALAKTERALDEYLQNDRDLQRIRAERAEADLATAQGIIEHLVSDLRYFSDGQDCFSSLVKARVFLERKS